MYIYVYTYTYRYVIQVIISLSFQSHIMFPSARLSSKVLPASLLRPPPLHGRGLEVGRKNNKYCIGIVLVLNGIDMDMGFGIHMVVDVNYE